MAATLVSRPPQYMLSKDPIFAVIGTDLIDVNGRTLAELTVTPGTSGATDGQTIRFEWSGKAVTFTCKTSPDNSGFQFPTKTGTTSQWLFEIVKYWQQNEVFANEYDITTNGSEITVRYKVNVLNFLEITNGLTGITTTGTSFLYWGPYAQPNLRCILRVEKLDNTILSTQEVPHDVANGRATFDLHSAFRGLKPALPPFTKAVDPANGHRIKYQFRFADKYGNPAVSEALVLDTEKFVAVLGGSRGDALGKWNENEWGIVCHNRPIFATVTKEQPQYLYFLHKKIDYDIGLGVDVFPVFSVDVKMDDGSSFSYEPFGPDILYSIDDINCFTVGYKQLGIAEQLVFIGYNRKRFVVQYTVTLKVPGTPDKIFFEATYNVEQRCSDNELYLLCETNLGGLETLRVAAVHVQETTAERQTVERVRWTDWTPQLGDFDDFEARSATSYKCQTPFLASSEVKRFKQLLVGKLWLCDVKNQRWIRVIADSKSITLPRYSAGYGVIEFNFKLASVNLSENDL